LLVRQIDGEHDVVRTWVQCYDFLRIF
jgi:hypothetical protein